MENQKERIRTANEISAERYAKEECRKILIENIDKFRISIGEKFKDVSEQERNFLAGLGFQTIMSKLLEL